MPLSWANALRPTIALFGCTSKPVMVASSLLVFRMCSVVMPVRTSKAAARARSTIATSSSAALPARSPMPLMVHSTCRAPAPIAAKVFATARPKSLWLWVDRITWSAPGTRSRTAANIAAMSPGSE